MNDSELASIAKYAKERAVPPDTFSRIGGGDINVNEWIRRLDKRGELLEAEIRSRGARDFTELLVVLEKDYCPTCDGIAAECPIADYIRKSARWNRSEFCPRCFGRFVGTFPVIKDGQKIGESKFYRDSEPYFVIGRNGRSWGVARCDCPAAINQYGSQTELAPPTRLCAVHRWPVEQALIDAAIKRWREEAKNE